MNASASVQSAPLPDERDIADMKRLAGGHDAALNELMERHGGRLFHYLMRCLQDESEAAEVAQESFVRVYQHRGRFDGRRKFSTWLYTIATNLVKDRYRWRSRHPQVSLDVGNEPAGESFRDRLRDRDPSPSEQLQASERAETVRRAVAALPEELRTPLILAEYEGHSQAEIGAILGCSTKAVETRISRARQRLRASLASLLREG
jgi:RNA polymerase sigma-70 factor (ECF subfamily)